MRIVAVQVLILILLLLAVPMAIGGLCAGEDGKLSLIHI